MTRGGVSEQTLFWFTKLFILLLIFLCVFRDAFDEDPEVSLYPMAGTEYETYTLSEKRVGGGKLAERLEDVDVI